MASTAKQRLVFHLVFLLTLSTVLAYEASICDEPNPGIYCSCDVNHNKEETTMVCFITDHLIVEGDIWHEISRVEGLTNLKLNSMAQEVKLDYVPTESLQGMKSLKYFTVEQASLGYLNSSTFSNMRELRELQLEDNGVTQLGEGAFSDLPKLKKLALSSNLLQELLVDSFKGVDDLEHLYLDRNNISRIEGCAFCNLHSLRDLELYGNGITDLTEYMFLGLRYLKRLDLYKNKIRILNDKVFQAMPKLVEIDLNDNHITHVAPRTFEGLPKLQKLMLSSNRIKSLPDVVFKNLPTLRNVDLYNNELETLQAEVLENMDNAKDEHFSLAFKENPIKCDCRLRWVKTYLHLNKSYPFTKELQELRCRHEPGENATLEVVHLLKMDCSTTKDHHGTKPTKVHKLGKKDHGGPKSMKDHETSKDHGGPKSIKDHETFKDHEGAKAMKDHETTKDHVPAAISFVKSSSSSYGMLSNRTRHNNEVEVQDSEAIDEEDNGDMSGEDGGHDGSPSESAVLVGDSRLVVLVTFVSYFLVRRRKGTLL